MALIALPAVAVALLSLAAFFGRYAWWLDLVANFRPQMAGVLLVLGMLLLAARWWKTGWLAFGAGIVNLLTVLPLFLPSVGPPPGAPTWRILSFNLSAGNESFGPVLGFIRQADPDLVLLLEASVPWEAAVEAAELGYHVYPAREGGLIFGALVLTREPAEVRSFGFAEGRPRAVEIALEGLTVLGIHPVSPTTEERAELRDEQMAFAEDWASETTGPIVVVGDFNATPWSYVFRRLVGGTALANSQRGFGLQASFPVPSSPLLRVPIDHLLHDSGTEVVDRRLGPPLGSDHFPLLVDLAAAG